MFKDKQFRLRKIEEVLEDLDWARNNYKRVERMFLCDGDALCLSNGKLIRILNYISDKFPECERVSLYGRASDVLRKTRAELEELKDAGLKLVYLGAESGSEKILKLIEKGETREQLIEAVNKLESVGIQTSVTFISGLAGVDLWEEHAIETGKMIGEMNASYVSLLTLMVEAPSPLFDDVHSGRFKLLPADKVLEETALILEYARPKKSCVFRSNHASNYVSLRGNLPEDNDRLISSLKQVMGNTGLLKDERFRRL